jgi:hypothetical protein
MDMEYGESNYPLSVSFHLSMKELCRQRKPIFIVNLGNLARRIEKTLTCLGNIG